MAFSTRIKYIIISAILRIILIFFRCGKQTSPITQSHELLHTQTNWAVFQYNCTKWHFRKKKIIVQIGNSIFMLFSLHFKYVKKHIFFCMYKLKIFRDSPEIPPGNFVCVLSHWHELR